MYKYLAVIAVLWPTLALSQDFSATQKALARVVQTNSKVDLKGDGIDEINRLQRPPSDLVSRLEGPGQGKVRGTIVVIVRKVHYWRSMPESVADRADIVLGDLDGNWQHGAAIIFFTRGLVLFGRAKVFNDEPRNLFKT